MAPLACSQSTTDSSLLWQWTMTCHASSPRTLRSSGCFIRGTIPSHVDFLGFGLASPDRLPRGMLLCDWDRSTAHGDLRVADRVLVVPMSNFMSNQWGQKRKGLQRQGEAAP